MFVLPSTAHLHRRCLKVLGESTTRSQGEDFRRGTSLKSESCFLPSTNSFTSFKLSDSSLLPLTQPSVPSTPSTSYSSIERFNSNSTPLIRSQLLPTTLKILPECSDSDYRVSGESQLPPIPSPQLPQLELTRDFSHSFPTPFLQPSTAPRCISHTL